MTADPTHPDWGPNLAPFAQFFEHLQRRLRERARRVVRLPGFRPASVLLPLVPRKGTLWLNFMQRTEDGRTHSGQIAFPGGAREPDDTDVVATALREAHEEVNIGPQTVTPLGLLDDYASISRYRVTPVVGAVSEPPSYRPDPDETQDIFEVPLPWLLDPRNERHAKDVEFLGRFFAMFEYHWQDRNIWGLTGRILHDFLTLAREVNDDHGCFEVG